ncbi:MAG: hypothetical protein CTY25_06460 [Methylobacterium sp.]|nr:MAG: hypothetical protein CTY25_06460 [Methylobacterium sp.]
MMRTLNILAIATLIGSATAAYSVKYETILVAEKLKKREAELRREKDAIAVLEAEWQILNRPTRLQALAPPEPGMQQLSARQIVRPGDVPQRGPDADPLDSMLTGSIDLKPAPKPPTPKPATTPAKVQGTATTPSSTSRPGSPKPATTPQKNAGNATAKRPASGAPLVLRPPAPLGSTRGVVPRADGLDAPVPRRNITPSPR